MKYWFFLIIALGISYQTISITNDNITSALSIEESSMMMPMYDVSLTKSTISAGPIKYGVSVPFNIVVRNTGDQIVQNIEIIDNVPSGYTFNTNGTNAIWSLSPTVPNGYVTTVAGPINPGGSVTVTINLILNPSDDPNNWINQAEILTYQDEIGAQAETLDANPVNNTDVANARVYDIALIKELITPPPYYYYDTVVFETTVYNQGNEVAANIIIQDFITEGYGFDVAANASLGWAGGSIKPKYEFTNLAIGGEASAQIKLVLLPMMADAGAWDNYAEVFQLRDTAGMVVNNNEADSTPNSNTLTENNVKPGDPDDNNILGNGPTFGQDEDDHDPAVVRVLDIALKKERATAVASYSYTQNVEFNITVYNQGNVEIAQYTIVDTLPCGLDFDPTINPGWTYDASINSVRYVDNTPLPISVTQTMSSRIVPLQLGVNPCYDPTPINSWDNYTEIESIIAADGLGNEDIDGELDNLAFNDSGAKLDTEDDNNIFGNGPRVDEDEDNHDVERVDVYDLAITNTIITPEPYTYGQLLDFRIRLINQGNIIADSIDLRSHIPDGLLYLQANNNAQGWAVVNPTTVNLLYNQFVYPADTVDLLLKLVVGESSSRLDWVNRSYIYIPRDTFGLNRGDDADSFPFGENTAEIASLPGDVNDNNIFLLGPPGTNQPEDDHDVAGFYVSDLSLTKTITSPAAPYTYNTDINFNIEITNDGGNNITSYSVVDYLPCGYTFDAASNTGWSLNNATGFLEYTDNTGILTGASENIPLVLTLVECANPTTSAWVNKAEISAFVDQDGNSTDFDSTPDQDPSNDLDNEDDIDSVAMIIDDLSLTKRITSDVRSLQFEDPITFNITVTNEGNIPQTNILITDYLKCGFEFDAMSNSGWSLAAASTNYEYLYTDVLNPGDSISIPLVVKFVACSGQDVYVNGAEITSSTDINDNPLTDTDSTPDNEQGNEIDDEDDYDEDGIASFDLSLDKSITSDVSNLSYGDPIVFEITLSNDGTIDANNVSIVEYLRCGYSFDAAINTGWALNNATGYLNYTYPDTLRAGSSANVPLTLNVKACNEAVNPWLNIAEISVANDPEGNPGNDNDSTPDEDPKNDEPNEDDIDSIGVLIDDLSLTKTITSSIVDLKYGDPVVFNINVTNEGNVPQTNILITDYLPCGYSFSTSGNAGWTQNAITENLEFLSAGILNPGENVSIPLTVTFVPCTGDDRYVNGAEITSSWDTNSNELNDADSTPDDVQNNEVADEDDYAEAFVDAFDLSLTKSITSNTSNIKYNDPITFNIKVTNEGTLSAQNIKIVDYVRCGYLFSTTGNTGWTLNTNTGYLNYTHVPLLASGESVDIPLTLTVVECIDADNAWYNSAEISTAQDMEGNPKDDNDSTPDENPINDLLNEDDFDNTNLSIFDLSLEKTLVNNQQFEIDDTVKYNIKVTNQGNEIASNIVIVEYLPCGLKFTANANPNWTLGNDGYLRYTYAANLNPAQSVNVKLNLTTQSCGAQTPNYNNIAEIENHKDESGNPIKDVDSTPDANPMNDPIGEDDIDNVVITVILPNGTIGNYIWEDTDGDGIQDTNEPGISGVTIRLYGSGGNLVATTTSGSNGQYIFTDIPPGDYYVQFAVTTAFSSTVADTGADDKDSDVTGANGPNTTSIFTLEPTQDLTTIDAGYYKCVKICGTVWYDINKNDINDIIENGINNIKVRIYRQVGSSYEFWAETNTGHKPGTGSDDGYFEFCTNPGRYYVQVIMPPLGLVLVRPGIGGSANDSDLTGANGVATTASFTLNSGGGKCDIKGGFYPMATLGNLVWYDENANGIQDDFETPAEGVAISLYDENDQMVETTNTNALGKYEFQYLEKKEYYIEVTPPTGYNFTYANGGDDELDSDVNHSNGLNTSARFMMEPGVKALNIDAGLSNSILPVEWVSIDATAETNHNLVEWTVASEINLSRYEVLKWDNTTKEFENIGEVNPNPKYSYSYEDTEIQKGGNYLYKIRQIDFDGRSSESREVTVKRGFTQSTKVYPNPASGYINIDMDSDETYSIEIINSIGLSVRKQEGLSLLNKIDINTLPTGKYSVKIIKTDGTTDIHTIIKIN